MRKSSYTSREFHDGEHRFEHWYRDNSIYFITARCAEKYTAFESEEAKDIFWNCFTHYTNLYRFTPIVTTVMNNHYHTMGYLKFGEDLPQMMRRLHGSIAKLVNDVLPERRKPF